MDDRITTFPMMINKIIVLNRKGTPILEPTNQKYGSCQSFQANDLDDV